MWEPQLPRLTVRNFAFLNLLLAVLAGALNAQSGLGMRDAHAGSDPITGAPFLNDIAT